MFADSDLRSRVVPSERCEDGGRLFLHTSLKGLPALTVCFPVSCVSVNARDTSTRNQRVPPAAVSDFINVDPRGRQWELVALTLTISYHDPHDLLQKVIVFQGYICILDSEQSGNCPKVELCSLPHKI
jgi:hypothetical protein